VQSSNTFFRFSGLYELIFIEECISVNPGDAGMIFSTGFSGMEAISIDVGSCGGEVVLKRGFDYQHNPLYYLVCWAVVQHLC